VIYDFSIKPDCAAELESLVADWFHVMKHREGFIAISLFRDTDEEGHFCAVSDWASEQAYATFHASPEHQQVADATALLFTTQKRTAYDLVYQVTMRECDA
jgi:quinol monooxygenase YgiN